MAQDIDAILDLILDVNKSLEGEQRLRVHAFCQDLCMAADTGETEKTMRMVPFLMKGVATPHLDKRIMLLSAVAKITGDVQLYSALIKLCCNLKTAPFAMRHALMMNLVSSLFRARPKFSEDEHLQLASRDLREFYNEIVEQAEAELKKSAIWDAAYAPVKDRVVVLSPQFLAPPHAPTMRALEYAACLRDDFGKTPIIVETPLAPAKQPISFTPSYAANRNPVSPGMGFVEAHGGPVEFYKLDTPCLNPSDLAHAWSLLMALSPELIIAISDRNITADLAALKIPTIVQPTTADLPTVKHANVFTWNPLTDSHKAVFEDYGVADKHIFVRHPGFSAPESHETLTRADWDLPDDAFAFAVVGTRLHEEVNDAFYDFLANVFEANEKAWCVFMGNYDGFDQVIKRYPKLKSRIRFPGFQKDVLAALSLCDASFNPDRTGGGRGGAYALHAGLPVLSLRRGDVASTVGLDNCFDSYAEMTEAAGRLISEPDYLAVMKEKALERAKDIIGVRGLVKDMLALAEGLGAKAQAA